jgi:hypothetical protein
LEDAGQLDSLEELAFAKDCAGSFCRTVESALAALPDPGVVLGRFRFSVFGGRVEGKGIRVSEEG